MLPKPIKIISPHKTVDAREKYLRDPKADFFLSCGDVVLPLHRSRLTKSQYLRENCSQEQQVHTLPEVLNVRMLEAVLGFYYGFNIELEKNKEFQEFLDVVDLLRIDQLKKRAESYMQEHLTELDLFFALQLGFQYGLQRLFTLCFLYLQREQFEQINYNKFDFLKCNFQLFQIVLRRHHFLKISGKIDGICVETIEEVIHSYCTRHNFDKKTRNRLLEKYVDGLNAFLLKKQSLRLHKLEFKQVLESGVFDQETQERPQSIKSLKSSKKDKSWSEQVIKEESLGMDESKIKEVAEPVPKRDMEWFKFGYDTLNKNDQFVSERRETTVEGDPKEEEANLSSQDQKQYLSRESGDSNEDPDSYFGKISTLLDHYRDAYQKHEISAKSLIFKQQDEQYHDRPSQIFTTARFTCSSRFTPFKGIL